MAFTVRVQVINDDTGESTPFGAHGVDLEDAIVGTQAQLASILDQASAIDAETTPTN